MAWLVLGPVPVGLGLGLLWLLGSPPSSAAAASRSYLGEGMDNGLWEWRVS